jgi:hypothetical protein
MAGLSLATSEFSAFSSNALGDVSSASAVSVSNLPRFTDGVRAPYCKDGNDSFDPWLMPSAAREVVAKNAKVTTNVRTYNN